RLDLIASSQSHPESSVDELQHELTWLPAIPTAVRTDSDWGPFVHAYRERVLAQIDAMREEAAAWTGPTSPTWAQPFLDKQDMALRTDLAVWRAVQGVEENDQRPTGSRRIGAPGLAQKAL